MKDIKFGGSLPIRIKRIDFFRDLRNKEYVFDCALGKKYKSFVFVERGSLTYTFKGIDKNFKLNKGDLLYIPDNRPYQTSYNEDNSIISIFSFDMEPNDFFDKLTDPYVKQMPEASSVFSSVSGRKMYDVFFITSRVYELLYLLEKSDDITPHKYEKISPALDEINQYYFENKKLSYYANLCFMSESNFRKLFKEYTGKTFIEYRNYLRLAHVERLLKNKECTVSQAALLTGFNNISFFYEAYRKFKKEGK